MCLKTKIFLLLFILISISSAFALNITLNASNSCLTDGYITSDYNNSWFIDVVRAGTGVYGWQGYSKWNISSIPINSTIQDTQLCYLVDFTYPSVQEGHVGWMGLDNQTWDNATWNDRPSGLNTTFMNEENMTGCDTLCRKCFNVTNQVKKDYDLGNVNTSFVYNFTDNPSNHNSELYTCSLLPIYRPYVVVTYELPTTTTTLPPTTTTLPTTTTTLLTPINIGFENILRDIGEGLGNFLNVIREPVSTIIIGLGLVSVVLFIIYAIASMI